MSRKSQAAAGIVLVCLVIGVFGLGVAALADTQASPAISSTPVAPVVPASSDVTFRFNPADGLSYIEKVTSTTTMSSRFGKFTTVIYSTSKVQIHKSDKGYTFISTPLSLDAMVDGKPVLSDAMMNAKVLSRKATYTCALDPDGRITQIDGFDAYLAELAKAVAIRNPKLAANLPGLLPALKQGAETQVREEWSGRVSDYVGKTVKMGELWKTQEKSSSFVGQVLVKRRTRFVAKEPSNGRDCLRMRFYFEADPKSLKAGVNDMISSSALLYGVNDLKGMPKVSSIEVNGTGERLLAFRRTLRMVFSYRHV